MADLVPLGLDKLAHDSVRARKWLDMGAGRVLQHLADIARKGIKDAFATRGAAIGKSWPSLKKATQKHRARLRAKFGLPITPTRPVLVNFGDLRAAMTTKGHAQDQYVGRHEVVVSVQQNRVNRHDRISGGEAGINKRTGLPKRVRGKGGKRYPPNIVDIHEQGLGDVPKRPMIGVPPRRQLEMDAKVEHFLHSVANLMAGRPK